MTLNRLQRARLDGAVRGTLAAHFKDYQRGTIDEAWLFEMAGRRANAIRAAFHQSAPRFVPKPICTDCSAELDPGAGVTMHGALYCAGCGPAHRREAPAGLRQ